MWHPQFVSPRFEERQWRWGKYAEVLSHCMKVSICHFLQHSLQRRSVLVHACWVSASPHLPGTSTYVKNYYTLISFVPVLSQTLTAAVAHAPAAAAQIFWERFSLASTNLMQLGLQPRAGWPSRVFIACDLTLLYQLSTPTSNNCLSLLSSPACASMLLCKLNNA